MFQKTLESYCAKEGTRIPDIIIASESLWVSRQGFPEFTNAYDFRVLNEVPRLDRQVIFFGLDIEFIGHVNLSASNYPSKDRLFINILQFKPASRVF